MYETCILRLAYSVRVPQPCISVCVCFINLLQKTLLEPLRLCVCLCKRNRINGKFTAMCKQTEAQPGFRSFPCLLCPNNRTRPIWLKLMSLLLVDIKSSPASTRVQHLILLSWDSDCARCVIVQHNPEQSHLEFSKCLARVSECSSEKRGVKWWLSSGSPSEHPQTGRKLTIYTCSLSPNRQKQKWLENLKISQQKF